MRVFTKKLLTLSPLDQYKVVEAAIRQITNQVYCDVASQQRAQRRLRYIKQQAKKYGIEAD